MKLHRLVFASAGLAAAFSVGASTAWAQSRDREPNISLENNHAESCADLQVRSSGEIAQAADVYTLQRAEVPVLEVNAADRGVIRVSGSARSDFSVNVCRIAVAEDRATAAQVLSSLSVSRLGGRFTTNTPPSRAAGSGWQVVFIVHAPSDARVNLETKNGPIEIASITGGIQAKSVNGPLALSNCSGSIDARTTNGPISFAGGGGDVQLNTTNGPIALKLANDVWSGPRLEAHTTNGPVSLAVPETFQTAVRVETDGHSPLSCRLSACAHALTDASSDRKMLQINGSSDTVRVSTSNGPVSVGTENRKKII
jgi:hypothetical protein